MFSRKVEEPDRTPGDKILLFLAVHYRGLVCLIAPIILLPILALTWPPTPKLYCGYATGLMAIFWLTECIPLEITSFMPVLLFPLASVVPTSNICKFYMNDIVILLLATLFLAFALQQCGICKRIAYCLLSYGSSSHVLMLFLIFEVTMMISSVMPNTAATALMTPIVIDMLKIYEKEGAIKLYETNAKGEQVASDITTCYLCAIAYSATFGGVMTLIGSATNLAFKGLYEVMSGSSMLAGLAAGLNLGSLFPGLPGLVSTDELPFLHFTINSFLAGIFASKLSFIYLIILFLGVGRNNSQAAKDAAISQPASDAVKKYFDDEMKKLGGFTMCEGIVLTFFIIALLLFAFRSPIFFTGIGPELALVHKTDMQFIRDSALATVVCMVLFILPASMEITKNFKVKYHEELPTAPCPSALNWAIANSAIPFSFIFLLGGGFALVEAGKTSMLHAQFTQSLQDLRKLPGEVLIFIIMLLVMIITNLASNVVVANLLCPIAMIVAGVRGCHSLWFCMAAGYAASFCFVLPIGNPGNLMVYRAGNIPLKKMMLAGIGPSIITLIIFYASIVFLSPYLFSGFTCISGDLSNIVNPSLVPPPLA